MRTIPLTFRETYLGGGHFVAMVARHTGFTLDLSREMPMKVLGEKGLIHRGFIKQILMELGRASFLLGRDPLHAGYQSKDQPTPPS